MPHASNRRRDTGFYRRMPVSAILREDCHPSHKEYNWKPKIDREKERLWIEKKNAEYAITLKI